MKIVGIIPARGGSVGVKNKNTRMVGGKPLVIWTIEAALRSLLSEVVVSTDDEKIAELATHYRACRVIDQPSPMKDGTVNAVNVCLWYLRCLNDANIALPDGVCMLLPTSPLRNEKHINGALSKFKKGGDVVISVCASKPLHSIRKISNGFLQPVVDGNLNAQRQDVEQVYEVNGAIYIAKPEVLLVHKTFHVEHAIPYRMGARYSLDVNTEDDLELVNKIM